MLIKYGKVLQMKTLNRNLETIRKMIDGNRKFSEICYREPEKGNKPCCRICHGGGRLVCVRLGHLSLLSMSAVWGNLFA